MSVRVHPKEQLRCGLQGQLYGAGKNQLVLEARVERERSILGKKNMSVWGIRQVYCSGRIKGSRRGAERAKTGQGRNCKDPTQSMK